MDDSELRTRIETQVRAVVNPMVENAINVMFEMLCAVGIKDLAKENAELCDENEQLKDQITTMDSLLNRAGAVPVNTPVDTRID